MIGKEKVLKFIIDKLGRRVIIALNFITNNFYFLIYLGLRIGTIKHDIRQKVYRSRCMFLQNCRIIDRIFFVCIRI